MSVIPQSARYLSDGEFPLQSGVALCLSSGSGPHHDKKVVSKKGKQYGKEPHCGGL
jgi:hypothetical protein